MCIRDRRRWLCRGRAQAVFCCGEWGLSPPQLHCPAGPVQNTLYVGTTSGGCVALRATRAQNQERGERERCIAPGEFSFPQQTNTQQIVAEGIGCNAMMYHVQSRFRAKWNDLNNTTICFELSTDMCESGGTHNTVRCDGLVLMPYIRVLPRARYQPADRKEMHDGPRGGFR